jgi:hypothetical protein
VRLYNRKAELTVYANDGTQAQAVDLSGLDFSFTVVAKLPERKNKKNKTNPVLATVDVMKLSETTRNKIKTSDTGVKISFGYDGEMFEMFEGPVVNIVNEYSAPDWTTKIFAKHAWEAYKESYFSRSYKKDAAVKAIINDVAGSFGLPFVNRYDGTATLLAGTVFDGESKDVMDKLAGDYGLSWEIANNTVTVTDVYNPPLVDRTRVAVLGPSILSGPIIEESLVDEKKRNEKVVRRIRVTSMLLPYIYPGVPIQFKDPLFKRQYSNISTRKLRDADDNAIYIVDEVTHRGSSMAKDQCVTEIITKEEKL